MDAELDRLEQQLAELVRLYEAQKQECRELKTRVGQLQAENARLAGKVEAAIRGVSQVLETLPAE
jgi:cell division protein FtsB